MHGYCHKLYVHPGDFFCFVGSSEGPPSQSHTVMILAYSSATIAVLVIAIVLARKHAPSEQQEQQVTTRACSKSMILDQHIFKTIQCSNCFCLTCCMHQKSK